MNINVPPPLFDYSTLAIDKVLADFQLLGQGEIRMRLPQNCWAIVVKVEATNCNIIIGTSTLDEQQLDEFPFLPDLKGYAILQGQAFGYNSTGDDAKAKFWVIFMNLKTSELYEELSYDEAFV